MIKKFFFKTLAATLGFLFFTALGLSSSLAAEKLKIATPVKMAAHYALPALAAEEKGFWREEGLQGEWLPFGGGTLFIQALAGGEFDLGMAAATFLIPPIARGGVDVLMVADLKLVQPFSIWVRAESPIKGWRELEGTKIGISTLGALSHSFGRVATKKLGLEGKVKFVAFGGVVQQTAALRAGAVESIVLSIFEMANLKFSGQAREIISVTDYLPKDWMDVTMFSRRAFVEKNPGVVRKVVRSTLRATDFVMTNRQWSIEKLKSFVGYSDEAAPEVYKLLLYSKDGKINRAGLENVINFLIEYGIVPKEKAPPVDRLFTREFTQ